MPMTATKDIQRIATIGMFDGVHRGHALLLDELCRRAAAASLVPTVFTFADHPLRQIAPDKCPPLLTDIVAKEALLHSLLPVGAEVYILRFDAKMRAMSAADFIDMLREDYGVRAIVRGHDHTFGHDRPSADMLGRFAAAAGVQMSTAPVLLDETTGQAVCSSAIRRAIVSDGDMDAAARMLGRAYALVGKVVPGRRIGRTIGFPTANIRTDARMAVPRCGVYAATVDIAGRRYGAMLNIGTAPTVNAADTEVRLEVHIFDFDGDIYDATLYVEPRRYLRAECRFADVSSLSARLRDDAAAAKAILAEIP